MSSILGPDGAPIPQKRSELVRIAKDYLAEGGSTGLRRSGGFIHEEFLRKLSGRNGMKIYEEMSKNDDVIGTTLMILRTYGMGATWTLEPAGKDAKSKEAAEFVDSCVGDMSHGWKDVIDGALSISEFGWAWDELVYKRRLGPNQRDPSKRSKFNDGRIGWRKWGFRAQDTLWEWDISDEDGGINGMWQWDMNIPQKGQVFMPIEKSILFRTTTRKNNPEGLSLLRHVYRDWWFKKRIQEIEAIGIERDLAGLPTMELPPEYMSNNATPEQRQVRTFWETFVQEVRRDMLEGLVLPSSVDREGKPTQYKFGLLSTGGRRQLDPSGVIERYDKRLAMGLGHNWLLLGQDQVGSYALASTMTDVGAVVTGSILDLIADPVNQHAIPRLMKFNPEFPPETWPTMVHGDLETPPLKEIAEYVSTLSTSDAVTPDEKLERHLRRIANLPEMEEVTEREPMRDGAPDGGGNDGPSLKATPAEVLIDPKFGLNGAQITASLEIIRNRSEGIINTRQGKALLKAMAVPEELVNEILNEQ